MFYILVSRLLGDDVWLSKDDRRMKDCIVYIIAVVVVENIKAGGWRIKLNTDA